ncbi:MAG: pyridoxal-phosphate dependent enzyme [Bacteroidota bacterium]|nr:pyridoxal-phosphate dependent enzyme [Bacteroidota bacterium]
MDAANRLKGEVVETKALRSKELGKEFGAIVFLKLENEQHTGSFKYRGALNKLLSLNEPLSPIAAASTGNHGLAISRVLKDFGAKGTIYLPVTTEEHKREVLSEGVADLVFSGDDGIDAEREARRVAEQERRVFISPYNDWQIIAGQGTVGVELLRQAGSLDYVFVSVGGGGLISGLALILKTHLPTIKIIGCSPERSNVMQASVEAGRIVEQHSQPTLSDGTAGQIESDTITLPLCVDLVDEWLMATEEEIANAMRRVYREHGIKIEGAAGVAVACFLGYKKNLTKKRLALIICGGNISDENFQSVLDQT